MSLSNIPKVFQLTVNMWPDGVCLRISSVLLTIFVSFGSYSLIKRIVCASLKKIRDDYVNVETVVFDFIVFFFFFLVSFKSAQTKL